MAGSFKSAPGSVVRKCALLSNSAYSTSESAAREIVRTNFPDDHFEWISVPPTGTKAILVSNAEQIVLAFQGTMAGIDFLVDGYFELAPSQIGGDCHRLFASTAMADYYLIGRKIKALLSTMKRPQIIITGHSLGGALAMFFGALLRMDGLSIPVTHIVTFGQPRCGNAEFARDFDAMNFNYVRFANAGDIVPDVPPQLGKSNWQHAGQGWVFAGSLLRPWTATDQTNATADVAKLVIDFIARSIEERALDKTIPEAILAHHHMELYYQNTIRLIPEDAEAANLRMSSVAEL